MTPCMLYELSSIPLLAGGLILLAAVWMPPRLGRISTALAGVLFGVALIILAIASHGLLSAACAGAMP